jgi:hypothetical protein
MIDFDALVLKPAGGIFQIAVLYTPLASQPGAPAFATFGVYSSAPEDSIMQNEAIFSDQKTSLGVRLRDFAAPPDEGDLVEITEPTHPACGRQFWIGDLDEDGQGGGMLLLRAREPYDS